MIGLHSLRVDECPSGIRLLINLLNLLLSRKTINFTRDTADEVTVVVDVGLADVVTFSIVVGCTLITELLAVLNPAIGIVD